MPAVWVGKPDIKVILKKQQYQWVLPDTKEFDINLSNYISTFDSPAFRQDNIFIHNDLGIAMVTPLWANRNNFIENINGPPSRYKVSVPKGAPQESENEINKRVWIARPTINQSPFSIENGTVFKRPDQEFAEPGSTTDLSDNILDNRYPGPIWAEEFHGSTASSDPTVKRSPPVSWVHQKNSNPNVEFFLCQKYGNFTNESFWIDFKKFRSEKPSNIPESEITDNSGKTSRFNRYQSGTDLFNYLAIRIGAESNADVQSPKGYDIVFPIDGAPFIYDHEGTGLSADPDAPETQNKFLFQGYVASKKDDSSWILRDDIDSFQLMFWIVRGKLSIQSTFSNSIWYFPEDLANTPYQASEDRYSNFFVKASNICIMGRGVKFRFNFNPLEFNVFSSGREKGSNQASDYHGRFVVGPFPVRKEFATSKSGGWIDYDEISTENELGFQNYTAIPFNKIDQETGNSVDTVEQAYGFDLVTDKYDGANLPSAGFYTSMMMRVNTGDIGSIRQIVKTTMRPIDFSEQSIYPPTGGPLFTISGSPLPIFTNQFLEVDLHCKEPSIGPNAENISKRFASPLIWRLKGRMFVPPIPEAPEIDVTDFVTLISYDTNSPDLSGVEQNFTVSMRIPKQWEFDRINTGDAFDIYSNPAKAQSKTLGQVVSRQDFINLVLDGVRQVEIWLGWWGINRYEDDVLVNLPNGFNNPFSNSLFEKETETKDGSGTRVKVFTGMSIGGPVRESYGNDVIELRCIDKINILKNFAIVNSPFFDGMKVDSGFLKCCGLSGMPPDKFRVRSIWASREVLPMSFSFQEPLLKFADNSSIYDAVKRILSQGWHVLQTDPDGVMALTDLFYDFNDTNLNRLADVQDLPLTHNSYVYHVDGWADRSNFSGGDTTQIEGLSPWTSFGEEGQLLLNGSSSNQNPFQRCYESLSFDKAISDQASDVGILTINRITGNFMKQNNIDLEAIENPEAKNFIGYRKVLQQWTPAVGEKKELRKLVALYSLHGFQSPLKVSFTTFGRPTLRPLDIIEVVHQDPKTIIIKAGGSLTPGFIELTTTRIKYRVRKVSGEIKYNDNSWQWKMNVEGEKL